MWRNSGHSAAVPDMAESTCSHAPSLWQIGPIFGRGSIAFDEVVPTVAQTKNGVSPAARSLSIARAKALASIPKCLSVGISLRWSRPMPAMPIVFSGADGAWVEVYAQSSPATPAGLDRKRVALSRAASNAHSVALEAAC